VDVDLRDFALIDPCGMPGLDSTSVARELGRPGEAPSTGRVADAATAFARALATHLDGPLMGALPPDADPATERAALERLAAPVAA
jgi:lipoate-protein ligase B